MSRREVQITDNLFCPQPGCQWTPQIKEWFPIEWVPVVRDSSLVVWTIQVPREEGYKQKIRVCTEHHIWCMDLWAEDMAWDRWIMEKTDEYFTTLDKGIDREIVHRFRGR